MSSFIEDGASEISAFASILLTDAFRRLPTNTHTFIGLSMAILHYDISVRSRSVSLHSSASRRPRRLSASAGDQQCRDLETGGAAAEHGGERFHRAGRGLRGRMVGASRSLGRLCASWSPA